MSNKEFYIGEGSNCKVFKATRKYDNYSVAIKELNGILETLSKD